MGARQLLSDQDRPVSYELSTPMEPDAISAIKDLYHDQGLVVVRLKNPSVETFTELTRHFSNSFLKHGSSRRKKVDNEGYTVEVIGGRGHLPLHTEMGYLPYRPSLLWFFCLEADCEDGRTLLSDAFGFWEQLSPRAKAFLESQPLVYEHCWEERHWQGWTGKSEMKEALRFLSGFKNIESLTAVDQTRIRFNYVTRAAEKDPKSGKMRFCNSILDIAQKYDSGDNSPPPKKPVKVHFGSSDVPAWLEEELMRVENLTSYRHTWRPGEVLMINNGRFLHGREAFEGHRNIVVRFSGML